MDQRVNVSVLNTFGSYAEVTTPTRNAENPLRIKAADIAADTGLTIEELPGKRFTAVVSETLEDGMTARAFERA